MPGREGHLRVLTTAAVLFAACMLTTCGCTAREMVTVRTIEPRSWIGRTQDEVVRAWGQAAGEEVDVQGRRVLVYRGLSREKIYFAAPEHKIPDERLPEGFATIRTKPASRTAYTRGVIVRFHLDDEGIVREYWTLPGTGRIPLPRP